MNTLLISAACELEKCVANHGGHKDLLTLAKELRRKAK
jgi:hypothetical protein